MSAAGGAKTPKNGAQEKHNFNPRATQEGNYNTQLANDGYGKILEHSGRPINSAPVAEQGGGNNYQRANSSESIPPGEMEKALKWVNERAKEGNISRIELNTNEKIYLYWMKNGPNHKG
ncbi:MAG: hypothetical protein Q9160_006898 [Pyrenula sp. 1 TL-2023]